MEKSIYNGKKYIRGAFRIAAGVFLSELLVLQLIQYNVLMVPMLTGLCFFLVVEVAVGITLSLPGLPSSLRRQSSMGN